MKRIFAAAVIISLTAPVISVFAQMPSKYVDPFIGTQRMGHTFPGATVPFGSIQLSPDTDE